MGDIGQMGDHGSGKLCLTIELSAVFFDYRDTAIIRLQERYPSLDFTKNDIGILVSGLTEAQGTSVRSAVLHGVYREKIYAETLPMRHSLFAAIQR